MDELFHNDAVMHWPQSGEVVRGAENRRGIYNAFPQLPTITPRRMLSGGNLEVAEALLDYNGPHTKRCSSSNSGTAESPRRRPAGAKPSRHTSGGPSGLKRPNAATPQEAQRPHRQSAALRAHLISRSLRSINDWSTT
ncbi:nuclear transport factor 2 family protein [Pseudarthrobacter cellobiosi]|uniref:nuclear transport factor 2 family protein n=1 Tax=Pseudarthrobacter cellobiosi TaxID=2953654 RepID=UPI0035AB84D2